jgi:meso-butanediol dehydrogenase/(S,S)-butanediol dehydrogenase/diacetyl reductase
MQRFTDKVALVTGAASGIGKASAERLASEGAAVMCADVQQDAVAAVAAALTAGGARAAAHACDVRDPAAVAATVAATIERFGALHVLGNVAGVLRVVHTHEETLEEWNRILAINLTGTFLMCRAALPHLIATRGAIVNMSSTAALRAHAWTAAYSASKGGVLALTRELAVEYGKQGVRVNALCPGGVMTPIHESFNVPEGADAKLVQRIMPFTGFSEPAEVAAALAFLASDETCHVTGTMMLVDGAMCA